LPDRTLLSIHLEAPPACDRPIASSAPIRRHQEFELRDRPVSPHPLHGHSSGDGPRSRPSHQGVHPGALISPGLRVVPENRSACTAGNRVRTTGGVDRRTGRLRHRLRAWRGGDRSRRRTRPERLNSPLSFYIVTVSSVERCLSFALALPRPTPFTEFCMSINTLRREWTSSGGGDVLAGMTRAPAHLTRAIDSRAVPFSGGPSFEAAAVDRHGECGGTGRARRAIGMSGRTMWHRTSGPARTTRYTIIIRTYHGN